MLILQLLLQFGTVSTQKGDQAILDDPAALDGFYCQLVNTYGTCLTISVNSVKGSEVQHELTDMNCSPGDPSQYWTWSKGSYAMSTMSTPKVNADWTVIFLREMGRDRGVCKSTADAHCMFYPMLASSSQINFIHSTDVSGSYLDGYTLEDPETSSTYLTASNCEANYSYTRVSFGAVFSNGVSDRANIILY